MSSNTGKEQDDDLLPEPQQPENHRPGTFKKGDPRINRNGRPKSFDDWSRLSKMILSEPATNSKGEPVIIDDHVATNAEMIARTWMKDRRMQHRLIEAAYGKVPQRVDIDATFGEMTKDELVRFITARIGGTGEGNTGS